MTSAEHLVALGRFDEARTMVVNELAADPDNSRLVGLLAQCQVGTQNYPAALEAANRLVAMEPDDEWGHRLASIALDRLGQHEEALRAAQHAVRLAPHEWRTHVQVATAAIDVRGRLWDGHQAAVRAVELAPDEASTHFALGLVAQHRTDHELARTSYERTLALDPGHAMALNNLTVLKGGLSLGRSFRGYAESLRLDPQATLVQSNIEGLASSFVRRIYYISLVSLVVGGLAAVAGHGPTAASALVAAALVVGVVTYAVALGRQVPRGVRTFVLRRMLRDPFLLASEALTAAMITVALAVCLVPDGYVFLGFLQIIGLANVGLAVWAGARRSR